MAIWLVTDKDIPRVYSEELGIRDAQDIDIDAIAYLAGARVKYRHLAGCEARIIGMGDRAIISVNEASAPERQRFSVGHELGHWFRDQGTIGNLCKASDISPNRTQSAKSISGKETIANKFASHLLMPDYLFAPEVGHEPPTFELIQNLKSRYRVSLTAAAIKALDHCDYPSFLVFYQRGKRQWFHSSPEAPSGFFPHRIIREQPRLLADTPQQQDADAWLEGRGVETRCLWAATWAIGGTGLMSLLWWDEDWID